MCLTAALAGEAGDEWKLLCIYGVGLSLMGLSLEMASSGAR
jgi:hypothetical protein